MGTHPGALAVAVKTRRRDLGLDQSDLAAAARLSTRTISEIESEKDRTRHNTTYRKLDKALQWPDGTSLHIYRTGTKPTQHPAEPSVTISLGNGRTVRVDELNEPLTNKERLLARALIEAASESLSA